MVLSYAVATAIFDIARAATILPTTELMDNKVSETDLRKLLCDMDDLPQEFSNEVNQAVEQWRVKAA